MSLLVFSRFKKIII